MKQERLKKGIIAAFICGFAFLNIQAQEPQVNDTIVISLQDALNIALSESPTIQVADLEIQRVRYAKKETIGGLLPTVSLSGAYQRAIKKQKMYLDGFDMTESMGGMLQGIDDTFAAHLNGYRPNTFGADGTITVPGELLTNIATNSATDEESDGAIEVGRDNTFTGGLSATVPLIAPALWATVNLSQYELELTLEAARASRISLINEVSKAYYGVLLAQDSYEVLKNTYENSLENARIIRSKYEQGTVSEFEWIRADVQAKSNFTNLISAESAVNLSILQLKMLMGIDMFVGIKTIGSLADFHATMYGDYMAIDTTLLRNNTDLRQLDIQTKQIEQSLKINQYTALPTLGASFDYTYMSMVNDSETFTSDHTWFPYSNLSIALSIPLFEGGKKHYKNKQIKVQLAEMEWNRINLERGLQLQAINYMDNIKSSLQKIESDAETVRQAEKAMIISQRMYDVGMATFIDVSNSELAYQQAGLAYNQSLYEYLSNKADLEKLLGDYYFSELERK